MAEAVIAYALAWLWIARRLEGVAASVGVLAALFIGELTLIAVASRGRTRRRSLLLTLSHVVNLSLILWLSWKRQWQWIGLARGGARLAGDAGLVRRSSTSPSSGRRC